MADKKTRQLKPSILQDDLDAYAGMQSIAGFTPPNATFNAANGKTVFDKMQASQTKEIQDQAAWQASRDAKVADFLTVAFLFYKRINVGKIILDFQISLDSMISDPDKWAKI